jgi:isoquinoline 1-oxidoreductase beta subunit
MIDVSLPRRNVLKGIAAMGGGLIVGFYVPVREAGAQLFPPAPKKFFPPNAFVRIAPDNTITIIAKHTEMGQGAYTGLATILADELDADWSQVRVESAPVDPEMYAHLGFGGMQATGGSSSIPNSWMQMRRVGATMRAMLVTAAAEQWQVPAAELTVSRGMVEHPASGRKASFGELSEAAAAVTPPQDAPLKDPQQFTLIGQSVPRVDSAAKSTGKALFTMDVYRPNMLTAVVARAPRFGGKLKSFDATEARKVKGVVDVVEIPRGVAVLATGTYAARKGRDALRTEWDESGAEKRGTEEIIADYLKLAEQPGAVVQKLGDTNAAIKSAARTFEATYIFPYLAHATMEPLDYVIEKSGDRYQVFSGTQMQSIDRMRMAEVLGCKPEDISITTLYAGGGFGRRGNFVPDLDAEVATILKASGGERPIKLVYTREDDMMGGYYRPLFVHKMRGAIDAQGEISAWENRVIGQSFVVGTFFGAVVQNGIDPIAVEGSAHLPYAVPNVSVDAHLAEAGVTTLAWRSVGHTHTGYSKETFLDEMLYAAGRDPVEARLKLMTDPREKAVLELAADKAGWGKPLPEGRARGVAYVQSFGTRVAQIAEVSLNRDGTPKVERVVCAVDCGIAINPDVIAAQIEGGVGFGLTAALYGDIRIEKGRVVTKNFDAYRLLRINEMPSIEVHIVQSDQDPSGIGEPGVPPIAPAVANAYFRLTGRRVYRLPIAGTA